MNEVEALWPGPNSNGGTWWLFHVGLCPLLSLLVILLGWVGTQWFLRTIRNLKGLIPVGREQRCLQALFIGLWLSLREASREKAGWSGPRDTAAGDQAQFLYSLDYALQLLSF